MTGVHLTSGYLRADDFDGFGAAAYSRVNGRMQGLVIGIFNYATELHGVQIGLLNYAKNNPRGLKLLPILNAHFD